MFETNKIEDVMTPKAMKVRPGHYIDTNDKSGGPYRLWVRHGKGFFAVDPSCDEQCVICEGPCKRLKLNAKQMQSVPKLLRLLNFSK